MKTTALAAPKGATNARNLIVCAKTRRAVNLTWSWPGRSTGWVDLYLNQQGIDTSTPAGKAMFQMMGVFAEFERAMIQERVKAGLARARAQGNTGPPTRLSKAKEEAVRAARRQGLAIRKIAREVGVGVGTVQRIVGAAGDLLPETSA